jgi:predicted glycoside hydrolase/deacetylase ChbG (UPF0249 family)
MKLIVNADDLGYSEGVNKGIQQAFRRGVVRSATVMVNGAAFEDALTVIRHNPSLGVGLHLNLTSGPPLTDFPYVDAKGHMYKDHAWHSAYAACIEQELAAQVEKAVAQGILLTHLDSHHHIHDLPEIGPLVKRLAKRHSLPVRAYGRWQKDCMHLSTAFFGDVTKDLLIDELKSGLLTGKPFMELMCHPGFSDAFLENKSSYSHKREKELRILCSQSIFRFIRQNGIELCNYSMYSRIL